MKLYRKALHKKSEIILSLYLTFIITAFFFVLWNGSISILFFLFFLFILVGTAHICPFIMKSGRRMKLYIEKVSLSKIEKVLAYFLFFIISFAILFFWYLAYYPGFFSNDAIYQYGQAISGRYTDWHPALQTFLTYTVPLKITGRADSIVFFQIIEFSCVLAYMSYTFLQYGQKKIAVVSLLYILLNPVTGLMLMNPWKDVSLAVGATLIMVFGFRIYYTNGLWVNKRGRVFVFALLLAVTTIFRHNAVLFTLPILFAVLLCIRNKEKCLKIVFHFLIILVLIKDPIYHTLKVQEEKFQQVEILGIPLSMLGNVAKEAPDTLDQETAEFMFAIAPKEDWKDLYQCGNYNSIKWGPNTNGNMIEETSVTKVLEMTFRTLFREPKASLKGLIAITDLVYAIDGPIDWEIGKWVVENDFGIASRSIIGREGLDNYIGICKNSVFRYVFYYVGLINFIILTSILCKCSFKNRNDWKKALFGISILAYNFGTMLLLSGNDFRFFYLSFPTCPVILTILFGEMKEESKLQEGELKTTDEQ